MAGMMPQMPMMMGGGGNNNAMMMGVGLLIVIGIAVALYFFVFHKSKSKESNEEHGPKEKSLTREIVEGVGTGAEKILETGMGVVGGVAKTLGSAVNVGTTLAANTVAVPLQIAAKAAGTVEHAAEGIVSGIGSGIKHLFSDIRLKTNIEAIPGRKTPRGAQLYRFRYIDPKYGLGEQEGVIAQYLIGTEMEDAVSVGSDGYYRVDYSKL